MNVRKSSMKGQKRKKKKKEEMIKLQFPSGRESNRFIPSSK